MAFAPTYKTYRKRFSEWLAHVLFTPLRWGVQAWLKRRRLIVLYRMSGDAFGDTIAMTTILAAHHARDGSRGIVLSKFPDIFLANPQVAVNLDYQSLPKLPRSLLKSALKHLRGSRVLCVGNEPWTPGTWPWRTQPCERLNPIYYHELQPDPRHRIDTRGVSPVLKFEAGEQERYAERFAFLPQDFCLIKASCGVRRHDVALLKEWDIAGMQEVVRQYSSLHWVQIGQGGEAALDGVVDLLGQTNLRETFYLLSRAKLVLTVEGMVSHAAAAFDAPVVVIFSGYHDAAPLCYHNTIAVTATPAPPCAPCWQTHCTTAGKPCTSAINSRQVSAAVALAAQRAGIIQDTGAAEGGALKTNLVTGRI